MSAIRQALINLDNSIGNLEYTIESLEDNLRGAQRDMFPEARLAMVQSLDKVIAHVETILEDA
jgi:hypothetical protein